MALLMANSFLLRSDRCTKVARSIVSGVDRTASEASVGATKYSTLTVLSKRELGEAKVLKYRRSIIRWYSSVMRKEGKEGRSSRGRHPIVRADAVMDESSQTRLFF